MHTIARISYILFAIATVYLAQNSDIDSILSDISNESPSVQVVKLIRYTKSLDDTSYTHKLQILEKAFNIVKKHHLKKLYNELLYEKGIIYYGLNRYREANKLYQEARSSYSENNDLTGLRKTYEEIGYCYDRLGYQDSARIFHEKDLDISIKLNLDSTQSIAYTNLGHVEWRKGNFSKALEYFYSALEIREKLDNKEKIASSLNSIGSVYWKRGNYGKALEYFLRSTSIRESLNDTLGLTISLNNIGTVFQKLKYYEKAESYFNSALSTSEAAGYKFGISYTYYNLGLLEKDKGNFKTAIEYFFKSLQLSKIVSDLNLSVMTEIHLGESYEFLGDFETARFYYLNARNSAEKYSDQYSIAKANSNLAKIMFKNGKSFNEIIIPLSKSYETSLQENLREIKKENFFLFYQLYNREGKLKEAFDYFKKYSEVKDNILNENLITNITNMIVKFEMAKTESENSRLKIEKKLQENELGNQKIIRNYIAIITGLALILIIVLAVLIRNKGKANNSVENQKNEVQKLNGELAKRNKELKASNIAKDKLFSIISHDLRNPAGVLLNYSEFLDNELESIDKHTLRDISGSIRNSAESILELVNNLLDWSRNQLGKITVQPEKVSVAAIFNRVHNVYNNYAKLKNITYENSLVNDIHVLADLHMIDSVVRNLVSNALKFTQAGGKITLDAVIIGKMCVVSVVDNGTGMNETLVKKLFNNNFGISQKGTREERGSGLGLMLSQEFIKLNGGEIGVESKPGEGSRFWFSLPLY